MTSFDAGRTLADRFRTHAGASTHLYGHLMRAMADDWEAGGPVRQICAGYEDAPAGSSIQLRLLAGVFRIVLTGRAPALEPFYPVLGGQHPPTDAWPVFRQVLGDHVEELQHALARAPQTNEVGRSAALLAGLFDLVRASGRRRIRLLELGASAGLNLLVDRYGYAGAGWRWGDAASPVQLAPAMTGAVRPEPFVVVARRGCDLEPVDPSTAEGGLLLMSYVWPFDLARHQRLQGALAVARRAPPPVDRATASAWLTAQLDDPGGTYAEDPGQELTVVWQSITELYWPAAELDRVSRVLSGRGRRAPLAHVAMEFEHGARPGAQPVVATTLWLPDRWSGPRRRQLGTAHDHGLPVRLPEADPEADPQADLSPTPAEPTRPRPER